MAFSLLVKTRDIAFLWQNHGYIEVAVCFTDTSNYVGNKRNSHENWPASSNKIKTNFTPRNSSKLEVKLTVDSRAILPTLKTVLADNEVVGSMH